MKRRTFLGALVGGVAAVAGLWPRGGAAAAVATPAPEITLADLQRAKEMLHPLYRCVPYLHDFALPAGVDPWGAADPEQFVPLLWSTEVYTPVELSGYQILQQIEIGRLDEYHFERARSLGEQMVAHDMALIDRIIRTRLDYGYDDAVLHLNRDDATA